MNISLGDAVGLGPQLTPPVAYQGGKWTRASAILTRPGPYAPFWDFCAGSGAVTLEAVQRGHAPSFLTLVDSGPWGVGQHFDGRERQVALWRTLERFRACRAKLHRATAEVERLRAENAVLRREVVR